MLSGAMDIVVVKHPDDTYKSSPFRLCFGAIKIFRAKEKVVNIIVNGKKSDLTMRLSDNGEAYFQQEIVKRTQNVDTNFSDGYSSPIEINKSAPSSPFNKINSIPINIPSINLQEIIEKHDNFEKTTDVVTITANNTTETIQSVKILEKDDFENKNLDFLLNKESLYDDVDDLKSQIDYDGHNRRMSMNRKMSYDVLSKSEYFQNKLRMCRENEFTIQSLENIYTRSNTTSNYSFSNLNYSTNQSLKIELSNSWNLMSKGKEKLEECFDKNKITKEEFFKDPWKVINNNNLAIRYQDHVYTWKVMAPIIVSHLAFNEDLPIDVISSLTKQKEGFFLWKKENKEAFKIDIKKQKNVEEMINKTANLPKKDMRETLKIEGIGKEVHLKRTSIQYKKSYVPSSAEVMSLNLRPGMNEITFVVSSKYQGTHMLHSHIFLWDSEDKIVISDLDGTITRSDVLGHLLPLIGRDWSQSGVVKLYNLVEANGYKIIYLTARAICQSNQTKNYLVRLTQGILYINLFLDNLKLPNGPLLMSPDGLVSSFKREVIDKTPQAFKIQCLTQILNLFPPECTPYFAGFGNKMTDAISYEAVGVNKSKIFIINEKGDITQYNNYYRTSYTGITELAQEMFPAVKGNNTYFSQINYFKPSAKFNNNDVKDWFS